MPAINVHNALVIVIRTEESKPLVIDAFDSELDVQRSAAWVATQPELLELVARALRLGGARALDRVSAAWGGEPGEDRDWLNAWCGLEPAERRRLLRGGEEV